MDNLALISSRSQIPHILNSESGCLTDSCIIQAIERRYDIPYVETIW
ncbi:hypothetical protein QUA56_30275 [Microcoleus sp. N3A4]